MITWSLRVGLRFMGLGFRGCVAVFLSAPWSSVRSYWGSVGFHKVLSADRVLCYGLLGFRVQGLGFGVDIQNFISRRAPQAYT